MEELSLGTVVPAGRAALCDALRRRAQAERDRGAYASANQSITASIPLDPTPASRYLYAEFLVEEGDLVGAAAQLEQAWEQARLMTSPQWRAHCCHALAEIQHELGAIEQARRYRQLAIRAELDAGDDVDVGVWLHDRAADALRAGELDEADACLQAAQRVADDDWELSARVTAARGVVAVRRGGWSQGIRWFVRAFHALKRQRDTVGCAATVLRVGCVLQMRGEWRRGAICFQQAVRSFRKLGATRCAAVAQRYRRECQGMLAALHGDPRRN